MHSAKRISLIGLLLVFLVGNIGVGIFTHSCATSGIEKSLFVQGEDPCDDHHAAKEQKSCCHESCESQQETHNDCCSTDVEYVHLSVDQRKVEHNQSIVICSPAIQANEYYFLEPELLLEPLELANNNPDPPRFQGRKIHNIHQIFVI
jgi:hypothetical protein